jgi:hypothetical protein
MAGLPVLENEQRRGRVAMPSRINGASGSIEQAHLKQGSLPVRQYEALNIQRLI